jgi:hypothetical protein
MFAFFDLIKCVARACLLEGVKYVCVYIAQISDVDHVFGETLRNLTLAKKL